MQHATQAASTSVVAWVVPAVVVLVIAAAVAATVVLILRRASRRTAPRSVGTPVAGSLGQVFESNRVSNSGAPIRVPIDELATSANRWLVRVDDEVAASADELGFAIAEFGETRTAPFSKTLATARRELAEAFALKQRLDDAIPESEQERRDWNERIISLCRRTHESLAAQGAAFDELRELERTAAASLPAIAGRITEVEALVPDARRRLDSLAAAYSADAITTVSLNVRHAEESLEAARQALATAEGRVADGRGAGGRDAGAGTGAGAGADAGAGTGTGADATGSRVGGAIGGAIAPAVRVAEESVHRASVLIGAIEAKERDLRTAGSALIDLVVDSEGDLREARALDRRTLDRAAHEAVAAAIRQLERALRQPSTSGPQANPVASLDILRDANQELEIAVDRARTRQQRLDHARTVLAGSLVSARNHLHAASDFIATRRGAVGPEARTRLAEADRHLSMAEAEAAGDPVAALDTARRAAMLAQDADALARYDVQSGGYYDPQRDERADGAREGYGRNWDAGRHRRSARSGATTAGALLGGLVLGGLASRGWGGGDVDLDDLFD